VIDLLGYEGKVCVITGAFSGMGEAAARNLVDLGAEVHALDIKQPSVPVKQFIEVDLKDRSSIDSAIDKLPGEIDCHFNCAGIPGPPFSNTDTIMVNFVGLRYLTEALIPRMRENGAIASITSVAGMGFAKNMDTVKELIAVEDFEAARQWCDDNPDRAIGYIFSKQCITAWTKMRAVELAGQKIRINCLSPAPTDTPMLPDFHAQVSKDFLEDHFLAPIGRNATPEEMGEPLVFLNSQMARFISGVNLFVDFGFVGDYEVGQRKILGLV
jgi:NAD(P)-dependent dehydrogenase (short-subunit alcohol dehydrogenase family)